MWITINFSKIKLNIPVLTPSHEGKLDVGGKAPRIPSLDYRSLNHLQMRMIWKQNRNFYAGKGMEGVGRGMFWRIGLHYISGSNSQDRGKPCKVVTFSSEIRILVQIHAEYNAACISVANYTPAGETTLSDSWAEYWMGSKPLKFGGDGTSKLIQGCERRWPATRHLFY